MFQPRAPLESEVEPLIGFLDRNLRPNINWSIAAEYPSVFTPTNRNNIRVIIEEGRVLAHAAIKFLLIKNVLGLFKVAAIGNVVTDPEYRNRGLSQKLIENCLMYAESEGADFAILWSDLYDFYKKLGFHLAGTEVSVVIETPPPTYRSDEIRFLQTSKVSPESILRLYTQHTCSSIRTADDVRKYLNIPNGQVFTAWDKNNELLAYAVEGKGLDLKGYVHEWGGRIPHLLPLLAHIRNQIDSPLTVITSAQSQNLIRHLQDWDVMINYGFLGMIKILNHKNLFFKIHRYARQLGVENLVLEKIDIGYRIGTKEDSTIVNSEAEITQLIFGPIDKNNLNPIFQKLLPIPIWVWGWDSV